MRGFRTAHTPRLGLVPRTIALAALLAGSAHADESTSDAAGPAAPPVEGSAAPLPATEGAAVRLRPEWLKEIVWGDVHLRTALTSRSIGSVLEAIHELEKIDFASEPGFAGADRAAFLLAQGYVLTGDREALVALAQDVSEWHARTDFTKWVLQLGSLASLDGAGTESFLEGLGAVDTTTVLGRELVGATQIRLATAALGRREDPTKWLLAVPKGSLSRPKAEHMLGLHALESGNPAGAAVLENLFAGATTYPGWREVGLELAGRALEAEDWQKAYATYQQVDRAWQAESASIDTLLQRGSFDALWARWGSPALSESWLPLETDRVQRAAELMAGQSLDLARSPSVPCPLPSLSAPVGFTRPHVDGPSAAERRSIDSLDVREQALRAELARTRWQIEAEKAALERWRRYLAKGIDRTRRERDLLSANAARLDSLQAAADGLGARLAALRDASIARFLERAAHLRSTANTLRTSIDGLELVYIEGPNEKRPERFPEGIPSPATVLGKEDSLAAGIASFAEAFARDVPELIRRSHDTAWRPGIIDRIGTLAATARAELRDAESLLASLQGGLEGASTSRTLLAFEARERALLAEIDATRLAAATRRSEVARAACARTLEALRGEREAIDYGLATAAYALATTGAGSRPEAIARLQGFLSAHEGSFARGDVRFHLADLVLTQARSRFRDEMAGFVAKQGEGHDAPPPTMLFVDTAPALDLYRAILREDLDYPHRDAVLFNAGMLLADEGSAEGRPLLEELVALHASSPFCQEAYLRLGDLDFESKTFDEAAPLFEKAALGTDVGLQVIAFYKLGWCHYSRDRFPDAADAFRRLMDVYETKNVDIKTDLRGESEDYFVHALARAGGASAFARYFDAIGPRSYEERTLDSLARLLRKFSLYKEALEADHLAIERFPLRPDALASARRAVESCQDWNKPDLARETLLAYAPRFAPGSEWFQKNEKDSLRVEGAAFARNAWKSVALFRHDRARGPAGTPEDYRAARDLYRTILHYWPEGREAAKLNLYAGEASAKLQDYRGALEHYTEATMSDSTALVADATWQRVAVTDAWYETTRRPAQAGHVSLGSDSLATQELGASEAFLRRFPGDARAADVRWRHANLAFAHARYPVAIESFGSFLTEQPKDPRCPTAANLRADAVFRTGDFAAASDAYASAVSVARAAGNDSLAARLAPSVPACFYKHAENAASSREVKPAEAGELFATFAARWPEHEHAHAALYRGALLEGKGGKSDRAVALLETLIATYPKSEYVQDAYLQIASFAEASGDKARCADALVRFADRYPDDASGSTALLKAADLLGEAGKPKDAEALRLRYIERYPNDYETAMDVLATLARRELDELPADKSISTLLPPKPETSTKNAKGGKSAKPSKKAVAPAPAPGAKPSYLARYFDLAAAHPELASRPLIAETKFLEAEEQYARYSGATLTQPIAKSIESRKTRLEATIKAYQACAEVGVPAWSHAAAYRIGQVLVDFGKALEASERPTDLSGDDLAAYDDVLREQAWGFYDRGEEVWSELLTQKGLNNKQDEAGWLARARDALWARLAMRFMGRPELEYPLVPASPPTASLEPAKQGGAR